MDITQGAPFESFGLSEATMRAIHNKGYEVSTPVQAGCCLLYTSDAADD